ncbi:MAG TPA: NAD(P)-dependent oxidoreductase, partial [Longimicrobiales bacterium]|nr:NAD(P)-dependent oxidoreductase [Longimicrobiales bacterium]
AGALDRMRSSALLVNVGRGGLVDEEALLAALEAGRLGGAALDVVRSEPLPDGHPFWDRSDVLVTPHVSAVTRGFWERETALVVENVARLLEGRALRNVVDPDRGY